MDQTRLVIDMSKSWDGPENREPKERDYDGTESIFGDCRIYLCPANDNRGARGWPGLTHYVGIGGLGESSPGLPLQSPTPSSDDEYVGAFGYSRTISKADLKRGQAHITMVTETTMRNGPWTAGGFPTVRGLDPDGLPYLGTNGQFGSNHRQGSNVLLADGSVRFLPETMSPKRFEKMATLSGAQRLTEFADE
jgi:prepilin-type processing-associated H-X9-DG protein